MPSHERINIEKQVKAQRQFFLSNKSKDITFRISQLKKLEKIIRENEETLNQAIFKDFGKSDFETYTTELSLIYHEIKLATKNIKKWSRKKRVKTNLGNLPGKSYIIPEPLGVTLIIGAWNYPYQLCFLPAIAALAAGNTVILKPSEIATNTSKIICELVNNNFAAEYFHVIEGGIAETTTLLEQTFDKIFFTGSTAVGKIVYQAAAKNLTPVTLELGGKNPTFVFADCDIKMTAKRLVWGKFLNAGQSCVAPDYILVEQSIQNKLIDTLSEEIKNYPIDSFTGQRNYCQIINQKNFTRLEELIEEQKVCAGGAIDKENRFISPTVLKNITFDDTIMQEEIFGPLLPIIPFTNVDEVIAEVKQKPKPLSCYVYSKNKKNINKILHEISFGGGAVNDSTMHVSNSNLPFGGVGFSGMGQYHGKAGFKIFSHYKSILEKSFWLEPNLKYAPYTKGKLNLIKRFLE